jgi:DNA-binding NarL/FixJ family response regulator
MTAPGSNGWVESPVAAAVTPAPSWLRNDGDVVEGSSLTETDLATLAALVHAGGDQKLAAVRLGIRWSTIRNRLGRIYRRLNVRSQVEAFIEVGWLRVPETLA